MRGTPPSIQTGFTSVKLWRLNTVSKGTGNGVPTAGQTRIRVGWESPMIGPGVTCNVVNGERGRGMGLGVRFDPAESHCNCINPIPSLAQHFICRPSAWSRWLTRQLCSHLAPSCLQRLTSENSACARFSTSRWMNCYETLIVGSGWYTMCKNASLTK